MEKLYLNCGGVITNSRSGDLPLVHRSLEGNTFTKKSKKYVGPQDGFLAIGKACSQFVK